MGSIVVREAHCSCENSNVATRNPTAIVAWAIGDPARERPPYFTSNSASIELLQHLLDLGIFLLHSLQCLLDEFQALILIWFISCAGLVFLLPVMLNLLAAILDLGESKGGGGAFQKVAK
jgi:hypothetical protein